MEIKELENYKQKLHREIDTAFNTVNKENYTVNDFRVQSERFLRTFYDETSKTSELVFKQDKKISITTKNLYDSKHRKRTDKIYNDGMIAVVEALNNLTHVSSNDVYEFNLSLSLAVKFLFKCYCIGFSYKFPKIVKSLGDDSKIGEDEASKQLQSVMGSIGSDIARCFINTRLQKDLLISLTLLYASEVGDCAAIKLADHIATEDLASHIAAKVLFSKDKGFRRSGLDVGTFFESMVELNKATMGEEGYSEREQLLFFNLFNLLFSMFTGSITSHIQGSHIKMERFTPHTKMRLLDIKNSLIATIEKEFSSIK